MQNNQNTVKPTSSLETDIDKPKTAHIQASVETVNTQATNNVVSSPVDNDSIASIGNNSCSRDHNADIVYEISGDNIANIHAAIQESGLPNYKGCKFRIKSNINISFFESELALYEDKQVIEFFKYGFPIDYQGDEPKTVRVNNHKGASSYPEDINQYLETEIRHGAILGPFKTNPLSCDVTLNPLNSRPKRDSEERRVIVDLSFPRGESVNSGISKVCYQGNQIKLTYPSVDSLVELVKQKGRGCALFKRDLKRAYRQFPIDPGDIHRLGFKWQGCLYLDARLVMGLRSAAFCCQRATNAVSHICKTKGLSIINYLDDLGSAEVQSKANEAFEKLAEILDQCGLEESVHKAHAPSTIMTFLGIQFNTVDLSLTITNDRLVEIKDILQEWEDKKYSNRQELQSLLGKLNFVASCVRPGRVFISRLLNFLRSVPESGKVLIPEEAKKDIHWWKVYLPFYNGISMMPWQDWSIPDAVFASDACLTGCGAWSGGQYFHCTFPEDILEKNLHINALELLAVIVAMKTWGEFWAGRRIQILCDNMTSVTVINKGSTRDTFLQQCLREIAYVTARFEFEIHASHIIGRENRIPDLLSRWHLNEHYRIQFLKETKDIQTSELKIPQIYFAFSQQW